MKEKCQCNHCEYATPRSSDLRKYREAKHEGIRYLCDLCVFDSPTSGYLRAHKESKHEGIRNSCDQCEYAAFKFSHLTRHRKSKHEYIRAIIVTNATILLLDMITSKTTRNQSMKVYYTLLATSVYILQLQQ